MANKSQKGFNGTPKAKARRVTEITRLEERLKTLSATKDETSENKISRIKAELSTLKSRI